jgi:hypothetical protein
MGIVKQKSDGKGSLRAVQQLVNDNKEMLTHQLSIKISSLKDDEVDWLSPLKENNYAEYSDDDFINLLDLNLSFPLDRFWPKKGPQWDALGKSKKGAVFLIEAKANIPEVVSSPTGAGKASRLIIDKALIETKIFLDIKNDMDWSGKFYQYTNRLAHLYFLRELNNIPAWLINIYFINDKTVNGPKTKEEWRSAVLVMKKYLGVGRHKLSKYMIDLFIDVEELKV